MSHIAIKAFDSNHLYLGAKFAGIPSVPVLNACGQYCDVVSFDYYIATPKLSDIEIIYNNTNKPVLIAEYAFRGNVCSFHFLFFFFAFSCQILNRILSFTGHRQSQHKGCRTSWAQSNPPCSRICKLHHHIVTIPCHSGIPLVWMGRRTRSWSIFGWREQQLWRCEYQWLVGPSRSRSPLLIN